MSYFKNLFNKKKQNVSKNSGLDLDKGIVQSRLQMIKMLGISSVQDMVNSFHYCPNCKKVVTSITGLEEGITNDYKAFANTLRKQPEKIIGHEKQCSCQGNNSPYTILIKTIFVGASPHQKIDLHLYIQYETIVSNFAVEMIVVQMNGTITKFSTNDRINNIGF